MADKTLWWRGVVRGGASPAVAVAAVVACAALLVAGTGCEDPATMGRFRATPVTNVILDELGVVDEEPGVFAGARDVETADLQVIEQEYVIGPGDLLELSIFELYAAGEEWIGRRQVSETGRMTIPQVGTFRVAGQTELEVAQTLRDLLSPQILKDPTVTVVVIAARRKVYSVSGAVPAPGTYQLTEGDFRLLRALAAAGGVPQSNADTAYVIRSVEAGTEADAGRGMYETPGAAEPMRSESAWPEATWSEPSWPATGPGAVQESPMQGSEATDEAQQEQRREQLEEELLESISPMAEMVELGAAALPRAGEQWSSRAVEKNRGQDALGTKSVDAPEVVLAAEGDSGMRVIRRGDRFELAPAEGEGWQGEQPSREEVAGLEWALEGPGMGGEAPLPPPPTGGEGFAESLGQVQEVIQVDLRKLRGGDWTQNLVIRPGDDIQVPLNATGIYSVMGEVARPGAYSLAGERQTLKQVISTAGPLSPTAWPSRCEIIRRIGPNEEVTCRVNLKRLFEGTAPDLYIKPHDIVNIGTHPVARFAAVVRQSFRTTYGFGFVYDRNFADKDFGH